MKILITGGLGFLGARLARSLLAADGLPFSGGALQTIDQLILVDQVAAGPHLTDLSAHPKVRILTGDLLDQLQANQLPLAECALVYHLAAAVSGECEANFDLGLRSNLQTTQALLEACRQAGHCPTVVFSSSVAVFGTPEGMAKQEPVTDTSLPMPQNSYGIQKFMGEQLMADYGRKQFIRARSVRLMTVSVRPGKPNAAASSFLSGMIREPLQGQSAVVPVAPETRVALSSPAKAIEGLVRAATASESDWGPLTALNLPSLSTTVGEMAQALTRVAGPDVAARLSWQVDPLITRVVGGWPGSLTFDRARALGLQADQDFDAIIRAFIADENLTVSP
jgi:nucleoside-diphosphate-sugar epimerase